MRQVGKTTLMRQLYNAWDLGKVWYDFDNPLLNNEIAFEVKQKATPSDIVRLQKLASGLNIEKQYTISNTPVELQKVVYPWHL